MGSIGSIGRYYTDRSRRDCLLYNQSNKIKFCLKNTNIILFTYKMTSYYNNTNGYGWIVTCI